MLRTLLRDFYADRFGAVHPHLSELPVNLRLQVQPGRDWAVDFNPPLADQLTPQFEDAQATLDVFRRGHVYCFRCSSSDCEHGVPDSPLSVFSGYDSTGRPVWTEFAQALIDLRDDRVDQLYARSSRAIATIQMGSDLRGEQLASFGRSSKTYAVLGQVIAGYYAGPGDAADGGRVAITLQIVEARGAGGGIRLHLNPIARMPDGRSFEESLVEGWEPGLDRARGLSARMLESLELQARSARESGRTDDLREVMRRVPAILRRLCESLERGERQGQRRTRHAEERREEQRPVHKALDDAREVKSDNVFFDERSRTVMVHGAKGRAHAFNTEGRHVTSFTLKPGGLELRLRTRRWRPASTEEFQSFKSLLPAAAAAGESPAA